jgi:uncharacterized repeat protein (TIGR01451 family)
MPTISRRSLPLVALLLLALAGPALADQPPTERTPSQQPAALLNTKHGPLAPVGAQLAALSDEYQAHLSAVASGATTQAAFVSSNPLITTIGDYVAIDALAAGDPAMLQADMLRLGARDLAAASYMVSGLLPLAALPDLATLASMQSARPVVATTHVGRVTSQGDRALRANLARSSFGVDGSGITIGTLSDSYNCLGGAPAGVTSNDLPQGVVVIQDLTSNCSDEGRAMMEIIHDVAPGASQQFRTAFISQPDFAQGVRDLAAAGSDIIVDDVGYFAAPMFQDGLVAQAVNEVVAAGATYFSAAGNQGRLSYEGAFRPAAQVMIGNDPYIPHDFDPGPGVDTFQRLTIPPGSSISAAFQWDEPFRSVSGGAGANADLDVLVFNEQNTTVLSSGNDASVGGDPVEIFSISNNTTSSRVVNLFIGNYLGGGVLPNPGYLKVVYFDDLTINEFNTRSSTLYGHSNATGAIAVGAVDYLDTPEFGTNPPQLRDYSSGGGTPIFFNPDGTRKTATENRAKPEITSVDGANTTFFFPGSDREGDGFPNFSGTSAAAPHAAAVAALLLEANPALTSAQLLATLQDTAIDIGAAGFDADSGAGLIQADAALAALRSDVDLQLSLSTEPYVAPARPLTYTLSLVNAGPDEARGVVVTHTLPVSVSFVSASVSAGSCAQSAGKVVCAIGALAQGASVSASIRVSAAAAITGTLSSSALAATSDNDANASNNSATATTRVVPLSSSADLRLSATANASSLSLGQPLTYTISISNQGPAAASNLTATIKLAPSIVFRTASGSGWTCSRSDTTVTCTRPSLASGADAPITVGVTTSTTAAGEVLKETSLTATTPDLNRLADRVTVGVRVGRTLFLPRVNY